MMYDVATPDCPALEDWQALFNETLPSEQREKYERHLEGCATCQDLLDQADEGALRTTGRRLGDPTLAPANPSLVQVLKRLEKMPEGPEPPDLYFLRPTDRPDLLGLLGPYEVQEVIGQGGMGVVLKAYEPALHRLVAIKVMAAAVAGSVTARRRFTREAQAAAAVCHENVVAVHGVHEIEGLPYLVMQYIAGESLQARLDRVGPLGTAEAVRIALQTAQGLAAAHAQGLIHRDIKPANLLLENGLARVKITDFGLARTADDIQLTQPGVVAGTPEFMAPEQARGEPVDHRADLFSLGSVLYAMCTGVPPFRGSSPMALLRQVSDAAPALARSLNPNLPVWLEMLIGVLLAKPPGDRIQSAAELAELLEGYLAHLRQPKAIAAPRLPRLPDSSRGPGKWRLPSPWVAALVVFVLAALGAVASFWLSGKPEPTPSASKPIKEYFHSFKSDRDLPPDFAWDGEDPEGCVQFEPEGLRLTLPEGHPGKRMGTGLSSTFGIKGDFEITMSFEVLHEPKPADAGEGTCGYLWVDLDTPALNRALLARSMHEDRMFGLWFHLTDPGGGKPEWDESRQFPTQAMKGRLRLVRKGQLISHYAAEETSDTFKPLFEHPFGTEDVRAVRLGGLTGGTRASLDFRIIDLRIRTQGFVDLPETVAQAGSAPGGGWLFMGLVLVAVLTGPLALVLWRSARRRRREHAFPPPANGQARPEGAREVTAFACSGCGKPLKVRTTLAGKRVRCPHCQQVVCVPGATGATVNQA
jgi:serine/threonine protein kinase